MKGDYLVIDAHLHTFHTAEAGRLAMAQVGSRSPYTGVVEEALDMIKKTPLAGAVAVNTIPIAYMRDAARRNLPPTLSAAERERAYGEIENTLRERLKRRNERSCQMAQEYPQLFLTITLDPILGPEGMAAEVREKVTKYPIKGLKLHPPISRFYPNDRAFWPAYEAAQELGMPIVFHCGPHPHPDRPQEPVEYANPEYFEEVLSSFPKLQVVLAHMGVGLTETWPRLFRPYYNTALSLARRYPNVTFDLSATLGAGWQPQQLLEMVRQIGPQRVLFGSDFPWWDPRNVLRLMEAMDLGPEEKRLILGENALRVFKLAPLPTAR